MLNFLKRIFSIEISTDYTLIKILGIKIKITSKYNKLKKDISELTYKLESYEYMQNFYIDITNLPKAKGNLRKIQQIQYTFLNILHAILSQHNIQYWVDFGTLLGAIRHKGFVPWDDDIDISMLRQDYIKFPEIFEKELSHYNFSIRLDSAIKIFYEFPNEGKFCLCDIYPYDKYFKKIVDNSESVKLDNKNKNCYKEFLKIFDLNKSRQVFAKYDKKTFINIQNTIANLRKTLILNNNEEYIEGNIFVGPEILPYGNSHNHLFNTVFPLKNFEFENFIVNVPNDYDKYLKTIYGDYYLFPKNITRNHITESKDVIDEFKIFNLDELLEEITKIKNELISNYTK